MRSQSAVHGHYLPNALPIRVVERAVPDTLMTISKSTCDRRARYVIALSAIVALVACNSPAGPPTAAGISAVSGNEQFAAPGTPVANPLVVLVVDDGGNPFPNAPVHWTITGGGGTLADTTSTSDASGHSSMHYTAGQTAGVATVSAMVNTFWTTSFNIHVVASTTSIVK